ncbi:MAG: hypothetical protein ACYDCD_13005 [Candidatus Acidiferrales bacterium]
MTMPDISFFDWVIFACLVMIGAEISHVGDKIVKAIEEMSNEITSELRTPEHIRTEEYSEQQQDLEG